MNTCKFVATRGTCALVAGLIVLLAMAANAQDTSESAATSSAGGSLEELPFRTSVSVRGGYDSNVNTASGDSVTDPTTGAKFKDSEEDSLFNEVSFSLSRRFGTPRTSLNLSLSTGYTYYYDVTQDASVPNVNISLNLSHAVSRRLSIAVNTSVIYQIENDYYNNIDSSALSRRNGMYLYGNTAISASYSWTRRFSTVTSYNVAGVLYQDSAPSEVENRVENYIGQQFRYLLLPTTTLTAEYRIGYISYGSGTGRDSLSQTFLAGFDHTFNPRFTLSLKGGFDLRDIDQGGNEPSPHAEGTLAYTYAQGSSVSWFLRYGFENSNLLEDSTTNTTLRTGLQLRQRLTGRLSGNLGGFYSYSSYENQLGIASTSENLFDVTAGLSYSISEHFSLSSMYSYTLLDADQEFAGYDRQRITLGADINF